MMPYFCWQGLDKTDWIDWERFYVKSNYGVGWNKDGLFYRNGPAWWVQLGPILIISSRKNVTESPTREQA